MDCKPQHRPRAVGCSAVLRWGDARALWRPGSAAGRLASAACGLREVGVLKGLSRARQRIKCLDGCAKTSAPLGRDS